MKPNAKSSFALDSDFSEAFFLTRINKCMPEVFAMVLELFYLSRFKGKLNYVETHLFTQSETIDSIKNTEQYE